MFHARPKSLLVHNATPVASYPVPVPYTPLTLPTNHSGYTQVVRVTLQTKKKT